MLRVSTGSPFEATVGYSRAVIDGEMIHVAGTTGYDYTNMVMPADVGEQARNALNTISGVLKQAGSGLNDVVRVRYYITDRAHFDRVAEVVGPAFADIRPAGTMVICDLIAEEMKIEIEVTARIGAGAS